MEVGKALQSAKIEVLAPDFNGDVGALGALLEAGPDVFNHNVETVPALYGRVRPRADYARSLGLLEKAGRVSPGVTTKSGLMLGLGESLGEVRSVLRDLRDVGCDFLTIGQYMRPTRRSLPVVEYIQPGVFSALRDEALGMGFRSVASSPLTRSSMNAEEMYNMDEGALLNV
jgi:lipoic acid synthetase